jgi:hypothetical protein
MDSCVREGAVVDEPGSYQHAPSLTLFDSWSGCNRTLDCAADETSRSGTFNAAAAEAATAK